MFISIHALLAESDLRPLTYSTHRAIFLSTLSLRRATEDPAGHGAFATISIHALLAESDCSSTYRPLGSLEFLSTLSLRRATLMSVTAMIGTIFLSTLSLRRATSGLPLMLIPIFNFYPRSPCGERLLTI